MQIHFDPGSPRELTAVAALIAVLRAGNDYRTAAIAAHSAVMSSGEAVDAAGDTSTSAVMAEIRGESDIRVVPQADRLLEPDAPDPAVAFAGGASAEQAFSPAPLAAAAPSTPAAPAAPVSSIPAAPSSPNPGGVEVDKSGLPWDGRIHSGPSDKKPKNSDGTWRKKRGTSDDEVAAVEAELRAALNAPAPGAIPAPPVAAAEVPAAPVPLAPAVPVAPVAAAAPVPAPPPSTAAPVAPAPTPAPAVTASGPAVATTAPSGPATTFAELMRKITSLQAAGALTVEGTAEISAALGIGGVRDLITRPDLVPSFDALLPGAQ